MSSKYDTLLYKPDEQDRPSIFSHCVPWNPGAQLQLYPWTSSVQVPLFLQGWLSQVTFWGYKITSRIFVNIILLNVLSDVTLMLKEWRKTVDPFWISHIFSILVSVLFNLSIKKLHFSLFRFSDFCWFVCFQVSETNILRCFWLDRQNFTIFILLFKIVLTQLSTSFSGPRRLALAWISLFFLVVHASTSIFTTVGYLAALTRSSNRQYVVKNCSEHEYECTLELLPRSAQLAFEPDVKFRTKN